MTIYRLFGPPEPEDSKLVGTADAINMYPRVNDDGVLCWVSRPGLSLNHDWDQNPAPDPPPEPEASFTGNPLSGNAPLSVVFTDTSIHPELLTRWEWDFQNNGSVDSTGHNPTFIYTSPGVYSVKFTGYTATDAPYSMTRTDYITVTTDVAFTGTPLQGYAPLTVVFTDISPLQDMFVRWEWDFQNNGSVDSTERNPTFVYTDIGLFSVKFTAYTAEDVPYSVTRADYVHTSVLIDPSFVGVPVTGSAPLSVTFTDTSTPSGHLVRWKWDFHGGEGEDSTEQNPTFVYTEPGVYAVKMTGYTDIGAYFSMYRGTYINVL